MALVGNIKGAQGAQGPAGPAGTSVIGAQGPPGGPCTIEGQIYIDLDTGFTYLCQGGTWNLVTDGTGQPVQSFEGPQGPQGIQGIQGIQGNQGLQGIQGVAGIDGQDGNVWFEGNGAPVGLFGNEIEGDLYLDLTNGDVYRFEAGAWL